MTRWVARSNGSGLRDMSAKVLIIAAMQREVAPLVKGWRVLDNSVAAAYKLFENDGNVVVVCAGIGARPARHSAESAISYYRPERVISAGLAGGLTPELKVGQILIPATVINSGNGFRMNTGQGSGILVTASGVAGPEAKRFLARQYAAQAVDMEAAAVAEVAQKNNIAFTAIKAISDTVDFSLPELDSFVDVRGRFLTSKFVAHVALRPSMWGVVRRLAVNSTKASQQLCSVLRNLIEKGEWQQSTAPDLDPVAERGGTRS
jgi:adenosylhomocysteine nucleosidase